MASISQAQLKIPLALHTSTLANYTRGGGGGRTGVRILKAQNLSVEEWAKKGIWAIVESSNVVSIRYDKKSLQLLVLFSSRRGAKARLYVYSQVTKNIAELFFLSSSLGKHTHTYLNQEGFTPTRVIL